MHICATFPTKQHYAGKICVRNKSKKKRLHRRKDTVFKETEKELTNMHTNAVHVENLDLDNNQLEMRDQISRLQLLWQSKTLRHNLIYVDIAVACWFYGIQPKYMMLQKVTCIQRTPIFSFPMPA